MTKGKLIVFYGINNLGKTTQAKMLVDWLNSIDVSAVYLKYPIYDLWPTGPKINAYLRENNPEHLTPLEFQELQVQNRKDFQDILDGYLNNGIWVVAEDYFGTGIAWGMAAGIDQTKLEDMNACFIKEDFVFFFDGERFTSGIEKGHTHERNAEYTEKARVAHQQLARKYGWKYVYANLSIDEIHQIIKETLTKMFNLPSLA